MSDGPHRSLPMRRHWKDLAKRATNPAYSPDEVSEALLPPLTREFRAEPLSEIRGILGDGKQVDRAGLGPDGDLLQLSEEAVAASANNQSRGVTVFKGDRSARLDAARQLCRGSVAGNTLIDCAIEAAANGMTGDIAFREALENALEAHARGGCHQIEEHHHRKEPHSTSNVRDRLRTARALCSYAALASALMSGKPLDGNLRLPKRTGINEGPSL